MNPLISALTPAPTSAPTRPQPRKGIYERPFWEAIARRELRLQCCQACRHVWYPPGPVCPACLSERWSWEAMSGRGRILAWTVFQRQYFAEFPPPHLVVSVALEEGPMMIGNMPGTSAACLRIDMPVHVVFEEVAANGANGTNDGPWVIPQWAID